VSAAQNPAPRVKSCTPRKILHAAWYPARRHRTLNGLRF